ncbi:glycosyltransferase [Qaidamihabitans albus]|uniref:glycosyltransferase n=1 Tax=Qaidamihabitans albus TaxID=2795733 RepID=UPI0018F150B9|nr:glycosyltransferase [Qaidamihabitans albus]
MAERVTPMRSVAACTVVTGRQLPAARVLARSYLDQHPGHEFVVLVLDEARPAEDEPSGYRLAGYRWLDIDAAEYLNLATCFSPAELADAVTPLLLRQLLGRFDAAVYLDAETQVHAPFADVATLGAEQGIVLAPRLLSPAPHDDHDSHDNLEPGAGQPAFDDGFVCVGRDGMPFLDFWAERSRRREPGSGRPWPEHVPGRFAHTLVRDPGFGVAYWNLHERPLGRDAAGGHTAAGAPLRMIHLSGYRPEEPWMLSDRCRDRPRVLLSREPELRELCDAYRDRLLAAGHREPTGSTDSNGSAGYGFGRLPDGSPLTAEMRKLFHRAWLESTGTGPDPAPFGRTAEPMPPHPFGDDGGTAFRHWLAAPAGPVERAAGLSRLAMELWAERIDLQAVFPRPGHGDGAAFRHWCRTHGAAEGLLPRWALPREPVAAEAPADEFGVNIAGYLTAELGLGEMARVVQRAVQESGVPVTSVVEEHSLSRSCRTGLDEPETAGRPRFPVSILAVNSDYTELLLDSHPEVGHERYRIGLWAWELEDFPEHLHAGFALVDEVWTVSEFCARSIRPHSPVPVKVIPVPVLDPGEIARPPRRPNAPVEFLFAFDFNSTGQRKNPWGVVTAFKRAFPDREDVRLTIKATNGHLHAAARERLHYVIGDDPRIELLDHYLSVTELHALYAGSDAYVSLHRSEGFGLTVAEAMVRGLPVIATGYSGTTEFLDETVGWPIPYELTEVGPGWVPYQEDGVWAEPDLDEAAVAMRTVADDPAEARRRGKAAREHILRTRSMATAADWLRAELSAAYDRWKAGREEPRPDEALLPLEEAREALHWTADPRAPSRAPFAPALRRLVGRALSHHDAHQRRVLGRLTDGARDALNVLARRIDRTARATEAQERRLDALELESSRRLADLAARVERLQRHTDAEDTEDPEGRRDGDG